MGSVMVRNDQTGEWERVRSVGVKSFGNLDPGIAEFTQENDSVTAFLAAADAAYTDGNGDTVSVIADYEGVHDRPLGHPLTASGGTLYLQNEADGKGWRLSVGTDSIRKSIYNAVPGAVSQYLVKDASGNLLENGRIKPTGKVRMINFCGYIRNCRDLGGWACDGGTIYYGKLFRSGVVASQETWIDPVIAKNIGIQHHIDFRSDAEADYITQSCLGSRVRYQRIPLDLYYANTINTAKGDYTNIKRVLRTITEAAVHGEGVIYNCSLGRDRTGTVTFMLLALLGVARADIDKEYELTGFSGLETPTYRTNGDYRAVATYLSTFGGDTLRDNAVWWFIRAGFSLDELNAFRAAMVSGTPEVLTAENFIQTYSVTNYLTNCTTSNSATSAEEGAGYEAALTFADGYNAFDTVTVTMGGVDVTADVYVDGVVSIPAVTGDVVITAVAIKVATYTNQLPIAAGADGSAYNGGLGYKEGYRLNSSGAETETKGITVTGFIPCKPGDVIRLANMDFDSADTSSAHRLALYDADKANILVRSAPDVGINYAETFGAVLDDDGGIVRFTIPASQTAAAYFRISAAGISSETIITINEAIN